ncbi:hypothetical protein ABPG75_009330 [Micractinium tetrahymenae]
MVRGLIVLGRSACVAALLAALCVSGAAASWQANLNAANQVPSLADDPALEGVTGVFTMSLSADGMTVNWDLSVKGIENLTMGHIHIGNASQNGDPAVILLPVGGTLGADGSIPMLDPPESGNYKASSSFTADGILGLTLDELLALADDMGIYVNLHTTEYPAGAVRGQVAKAMTWEADLNAENQVPPLTEADVNGAMAKFTLSMAEGSDSWEYTLDVMGIENMTMAHIHAGNASENGAPVVILVPVGGKANNNSLPMLKTPESGSKVYMGSFTEVDLIGTTGAEFMDALVTDPAGSFYVNVHTEAFPAGAIRGQLMSGDMGGMEPSMAPMADEPMEGPGEYAPTPMMAPASGAGRIGFSMAALAAALAALLL